MTHDRTNDLSPTTSSPAAPAPRPAQAPGDHTSTRVRHGKAYLIAMLIIAAAALMTACGPTTRTQGATTSANPVWNPAYVGQCTWGAEEQWHQATGTYMAVSGDAWQWGNTAAANGWSVTSTPSTRAIVVTPQWQAGADGYGHVAWVTEVSQHTDGPYLTVTEMNWTYGRYNWDTRILKAEAGMSYILAP